MSRLEDLPPLLTPLEAAGALRVSRRQLYDLIGEGKLRATDINGGRRPTYRIKRDDVIAFINGDTNQGPSSPGRQAA